MLVNVLSLPRARIWLSLGGCLAALSWVFVLHPPAASRNELLWGRVCIVSRVRSGGDSRCKVPAAVPALRRLLHLGVSVPLASGREHDLHAGGAAGLRQPHQGVDGGVGG